VSFQLSFCKFVHTQAYAVKVGKGQNEGHFTLEIWVPLSLDILWTSWLFWKACQCCWRTQCQKQPC